ncbi:MAG: chorismate synthase [Chloroflexi bacterium]|nr:chorismate synthase [Chloroflexota bacterium]
MSILRFLTAGESHGPKLTAILEGMVAGLPVTAEAINRELARRQQGYGSGGRMKIEQDEVHIAAGVMAGYTTGAPIGLEIANLDYRAWATKDVPPMTVPRPGHADLTAALKYGYRDLRLALERASARETAGRVAVGAICKAYLAQFGIIIGGYVTAIGAVEADLPEELAYAERFARAEAGDVRCPDPAAADAMRRHIWDVMQARDTVGGVFEVIALGLPPGLGSHVHWDRRLDGRLLAALGSIPAIKGVEIGPAFANTRLRGTQVHDEIVFSHVPGTCEVPGTSRLGRASNRAGGLEGGITTGEPLVLRCAMKPIATTLTPLGSVDLATGEPTTTRYERSDFCAVPRAVVIGEAMVAYVLTDELMGKLGGDSLAEQLPRFAALPRGRVDELPMDDVAWRFGYEA